MKTIEIITVRLDPRRQDSLLRELRTTLETQRVSDDRVNVEVYRHATVKTDVSVHLLFESFEPDAQPSALGQRLASALKEFGLVSHSLWIGRERGTNRTNSRHF